MTYHYKTLGLASAVALSMLAGAVQAATLNGTFTVEAVNITDANAAQSEATLANFNAAFVESLATFEDKDTFTYTGDLSFRQADTNNDATTIADWLATGSGTVSGLDGTFGALTLSSPDIFSTPGTATSTFFKFTLASLGPVDKFVVNHDDGMNIYEGTDLVGGFNGPNSEVTTIVSGFGGGEFNLVYVATNGDPSVLEVSAVPLPAAGWLMLAGFGGLAALRRRKRAA